MSGNNTAGSSPWKPTPEQELLLRACLWNGNAAVEAWREWAEQTRYDTLDMGSRRLLAFLYLNLHELGVPAPQLTRLRHIFDYCWAQYRLLRVRAAEALQVLETSGIPTMVLKGGALAPLYYRHPAARPMTDIDVLVPTARAREALEVLHGAGWQPTERPLSEFSTQYFERHYAHTLRNQTQENLDLHRHFAYLVTDDAGDEDLWEGATQFTFGGCATRALNPADQLLHACAHAMPWNPIPPVRWVADAMVVIRSDKIDWDRFLQQTFKHKQVLTARVTMQYLKAAFDAPIPATVLDTLERVRVSRAHEREFRLLVQPPWEHNTLTKLWYHYGQYRLYRNVYRDQFWALRFPAFLRDTWALRRTSDVFKYMMGFSLKWVNRRVTATRELTKD